jgi:hypothetical protein
MSQAIVISPSPIVNLDTARGEFVKGLKKTGEVLKTYAEGMCQAFNLIDNQGNVTTPWYELKGKLKAGVNEERAKFVAEMQVAGFEKGTIDVYWQRVKEASGRAKTSTKVQGGGNDTDSKTLAELKTMINRIFKAEEAGEVCNASEIKGILMEAYESLGGDTDKLG